MQHKKGAKGKEKSWLTFFGRWKFLLLKYGRQQLHQTHYKLSRNFFFCRQSVLYREAVDILGEPRLVVHKQLGHSLFSSAVYVSLMALQIILIFPSHVLQEDINEQVKVYGVCIDHTEVQLGAVLRPHEENVNVPITPPALGPTGGLEQMVAQLVSMVQQTVAVTDSSPSPGEELQ